MSFSITGKKITLTRGDSLIGQVDITIEDEIQQTSEPYTPEAGDRVRFALKHDYTDETPLLIKEIPTDTMTLELEPADTKGLPFGDYVYDVKITFADGRVDTFIKKGKFKLEEEVD